MFCNFYFNSSYSLEEQKQMILNHFIYQSPVRLLDSAETIQCRNEQREGLEIICEAFTFFIQNL